MRYRRVQITGATYFFTLVTFEREPLFAAEGAVELRRNALAKIQRQRPFVIEAEAVLPDHIHMLWTMPDGDADYATRIRLAKTAFTKSFAQNQSVAATSKSRSAKGEREIWQRRYWEHTIRDERDFQARLDYIHYNPVRHEFAATPADWPYSSFSAWVGKGVYDPGWGSDAVPDIPDWASAE